MSWLYLIIAIVGEVVATSCLKLSNGFTKLIPSIVVVVGYAITFAFFSLALKEIPLSIAYAIWGGLGIVIIAAISIVIFKQQIDLPGIIGISFIVAGTLIVNLFSKMTSY